MDQLRPPGADMPFPAPRRHSTVPTSFQPTAPRAIPEPAANGSVETLYNHPSVKIVAFTAGRSAFDRLGPGLDDKPGTLPSSSQFERAIAVGAFQIYRAPGSVAFLRCGTALQPILPKSQCWCIDELSSKFVLQIRRPNYWRIEVPVSDAEDTRRALLLREILDKVLQLEKTPCPFERSFTVELPERPKTPVKKRPWAPPVRTASLNWSPVQQPVTPPPEFATRTRFYNPNARRFSDFGVDTSRMRLTPATPPTSTERPEDAEQAEKAVEKSDTPTRVSRQEERAMICKPLPEEPEPLSPLPTAIPLSFAETLKEPISKETVLRQPPLEVVKKSDAAEAASLPTEARTTQNMKKKREPIWITKPPTTRKPKISTTDKAQAVKPVVATAVKPHEVNTDKEALWEDAASEPSSGSPSGELRRGSTDESEAEGSAIEGSGQLRVRRSRVAAFASRRAAAASPRRLRTPSSSSNITCVVEETPEEPAEPGSPAESSDSFHSTQSWHSLTPLPPSPPMSPSKNYPYPHDYIPLLDGSRRTEHSEFTSTPTVAGWDRKTTGATAGSGTQTPNTPFTPTFEVSGPEEENKSDSKLSEEEGPEKAFCDMPIATKDVADEDLVRNTTDTDSLSASWSSAASRTSSCSNSPIRHRHATTSVSISHSTRALSPLPPPANLVTPYIPRLPRTASDLTSHASAAVKTIRRIPSSLFNKTCDIFLAPPAHLMQLMLKVAARIAAGEWRGFVFGLGEGGELVDVRWDWSDSDIDESGAALEGWEESDFHFSSSHHRQRLRNRSRGRSRASFAAADLSRPARRPPGMIIEYQDPWAEPPEEPEPAPEAELGPDEEEEEEDWSRNWGVD